MSFNYQFPAVRGIQAGKEYYIAMVPLKLLSRLFVQDTSGYVLPEYRAQRRLNETRIPEIKEYILNNRDTYVFSALSASIDGSFTFMPNKSHKDLGILEVPMDSVFLINDGQHRKAAIDVALDEDPTLGDETISIVFLRDDGLLRSQQMFTDLNKHAVKTSNSLDTLYNHRDPLAMVTKRVMESVEFFRKYTDKERDNLGKNSSNIFTLNNIYVANSKIIHKKEISKDDEEFIFDFWNNVANNIVEWNDLLNREISKRDLREHYIITLAITLKALGRLGAYFYNNRNINMTQVLAGLQKIDWLRNNKENWEGRILRENGKVLNSELASTLTCAKIKSLLGLTLSKEEISKEKQLMERK